MHVFVKIGLNYFALFYASTLGSIVILHFLAIIFYTKSYTLKVILINRYFIFILISFIGLAILNISNLYRFDYYISSSSTCYSFFDNLHLINNGFLLRLCINPKLLYLFFSIIFLIYLVIIRNNIDFSKCFIKIGLIFALISILHFCLDIILRENFYYFYNNVFKKYNASNNYAYFQLLPFYLSGFRNIEIFPIISGYFFSLVNYLYSPNSNKKKTNLYTTIFLGVCVFFSYSRLSWITVVAINIICIYFLYKIKKINIYLKYLSYQIIFFLSFFLIFFYFWNYSELIFKTNSKPRTNLFYYTMMKISSLYPLNNKWPDYFNKLNKNGWDYYIDEGQYKNFIEKYQNIQDNQDLYFDYVVKVYMNQHLNSTLPRVEIYKQSIDHIKKNFLLGQGNNFSFNLSTTEKTLVKTIGNAESDFLQYFLEMGIFGFLFKIIIYLCLFLNNNLKNYSYQTVVTGTTFLISTDLFLSTSQYYYYWIFLTALLSKSFIKENIK